tara:strand:+ start:1768 stop:2385 length:618 start_codon:yes stop_codon:yes gene_type:complete
MKAIRIMVLGVIAVLIMQGTTPAQQKAELTIGAAAPLTDVKMEDVSGRMVSLNDVAGENGLLVVFTCNTCPWVMKWEDRYPMMADLARTNNVGMIALNPNEDYRDRGDGMEDMIKRSKKAGYTFPYVLDKDHKLADAFGATRTPHVYLFNGDMELVYVGAIDDNANDAAAVKEFYIRNAIEQMIAGESLSKSKTRSLGCSIKRVG